MNAVFFKLTIYYLVSENNFRYISGGEKNDDDEKKMATFSCTLVNLSQ